MPERGGMVERRILMLVRDVMVRGAETATPDTSVLFVARKMMENGIGCVPVIERDRVVGIITDRDIACRGVAQTDDLKEFKARDVMTAEVFCCFEDQDIADAVNLMLAKNIYHLPVLGLGQQLSGMLALSDIALKGNAEFSAAIGALYARDAHGKRGTPKPLR